MKSKSEPSLIQIARSDADANPVKTTPRQPSACQNLLKHGHQMFGLPLGHFINAGDNPVAQ